MLSTKKLKKIISGMLIAGLIFSILPASLSEAAEKEKMFPYVLYAADPDGSIDINATAITVNGDIHSNGDFIRSSNYFHMNGKVTDNEVISESLMKTVTGSSITYLGLKMDGKYFAQESTAFHPQGYAYADMNMNIINNIFALKELSFTGNLALNSAVGAIEDVRISDGNCNANTAVIYSGLGDVIITGQQVSVNGIIYAPFGTVVIDCENFNLNGMIIAQNIIIDCNIVNMNFSHSLMQEIIDIEVEPVEPGEPGGPIIA
ncbi:MAG: hypothetical protein GX237_05195 [Clostridiales bacterium]|nr:hypothetical protein [Clostridiales bacterium]